MVILLMILMSISKLPKAMLKETSVKKSYQLEIKEFDNHNRWGAVGKEENCEIISFPIDEITKCIDNLI